LGCFDTNLAHLISHLNATPPDAIVVAPEVCLTGFAYDRFEAAAAFTWVALEALLGCVGERLLIFTAITHQNGHFYNTAYALSGGKILHTQSKAHLFTLGNEGEYFTAGATEGIVAFRHEGITIGILICFEMRFLALWERLRGCDLIVIPAQWGKLRAEHFYTLSGALALMNQCYVIACDAHNDDNSGHSAIITPFGERFSHGDESLLNVRYESKTLKAMRRYLTVGITHDG
jgi:predicted amidohydrolase